LPPHPYGAVDRSWKERGRTVDGKGQKKVMQGRSHYTHLLSISSVSSIGASTAEEWVGIKKWVGECKLEIGFIFEMIEERVRGGQKQMYWVTVRCCNIYLQGWVYLCPPGRCEVGG
jgi:hypothetical protein